VTDKNAPARGPIPGYVVGQYFGIFHGALKQDFAAIVAAAPFDKCNLLILAFVRTVSHGADNVAVFTNWRDNGFLCEPGDTDRDRMKLVVETARAKNQSIKILVSLGWGNNDVRVAAMTPGPFAKSVAAIVQEFGLDGFDIDYESADVSVDAMLELAQLLRTSLDSVTPKREMILTIAPAQREGLDKHVLELFTYVMPQSYIHGGNLTKVDWYQQQLGSFDRIVYGLNAEGFRAETDSEKKPDDPGEFAADARKNRAAGIFAWRLDTDNLDPFDPFNPAAAFPTFAAAEKMWALMNAEEKG
jgi:glycosyl hydrolase family 18 (putative chitinase)